MLTLERPALIWNLLEMMHNMVLLCYTQLFWMLLVHLTALANGRMPEPHPLSIMLHCLRGLLADSSNATSASSSPSSSSSSSSRPASTASKRTMTTDDKTQLSRILPSLLEQAWIFNAKILFDHFNLYMLQLYSHIFLNSCSINLPMAIVDAAIQRIKQIETRPKFSTTADARLTDRALVSKPNEEYKMLHRLLALRMNALPPQDYEMLGASSIAALRDRGDLILSKGVDFNVITATSFRILVALIISRILEGWPAVMERSTSTRNETDQVPRIYAGNIACTIRTLMELNIEPGSGGSEASAHTVEHMRAIVALREYAQGETGPKVVQEMWPLEEALIAVGKYGKAQDVGRDVYRRLERYVQEIPISCA